METDAAETARRRYGNGTEAAQGMVRKQYGVRHGSSTGYGTETAERRHGDGRAAARRRQGGGTEVKTHGFSFRGFFSIFVKTNQATR